jgi:hypothetical protein
MVRAGNVVFFILNINNNDILCISDRGTTGLNGTKFTTHEELTEILEKIVSGNQQGEDLACFLNSNWSAKSSEEGGNRGRGKTLFLVASQNKKVFFESNWVLKKLEQSFSGTRDEARPFIKAVSARLKKIDTTVLNDRELEKKLREVILR